MRALLQKEWKLAMHPAALLFLGLSAMLLIPSYPFYVVFFYTGLGIFFICLNGRETNDIGYTLLMPVRKRDVVTARFLTALALEGIQLLLAVGFGTLRAALGLPNEAGMDVNLAFFGNALALLGFFNLEFFRRYYRAPDKPGRAFALASAEYLAVMLVMEASCFAVPFVRDRLDTPDPAHLPEKLCVLAAGAAVFVLLTALAHRKSVRSFEKLDF